MESSWVRSSVNAPLFCASTFSRSTRAAVEGRGTTATERGTPSDEKQDKPSGASMPGKYFESIWLLYCVVAVDKNPMAMSSLLYASSTSFKRSSGMGVLPPAFERGFEIAAVANTLRISRVDKTR